MRLELSPDEVAVREAIGPGPFLRGYRSARDGSVADYRWDEGGRVLQAAVAGTTRRPHNAKVVVSRHADGSVRTVVGACTCAAGANCEHIAAAMLTALWDTDDGWDDDWDDDGSLLAHAPTPVSMPQWEAALLALGEVGADDEAGEAAAVALQFEVAPSDIVLRPVVSGRNGGWVRTGISWRDLGGLRWSAADTTRQHYRLLSELRAMHDAEDNHGYSYHFYNARESRITLSSIRTRRVWDLLAEMRATGLPFVQAGKSGAPVVLHREAATLTFDLTEAENGIGVCPRIAAETFAPPADATCLGEPTHGLAWGDDAGAVHLARFSALPGVNVQGILAQPPVTVPDEHREQFFGVHVPQLRRVAEVRSIDGSVTVPETLPPVLTLLVVPRGDHRTHLSWTWVYTLGQAQRRVPLWPGVHRDVRDRDVDAEHRTVTRAAAVLGAVPALFRGGVLAAECYVAGMDTVRLFTELLAELELLDDVRVEVRGEAADYRPAVAPPVIALDGPGAEQAHRDWFDLTPSVTVDGQPVPFLLVFEALARGDDHLILASGTYLPLDQPEFAELARLIAESRALLDAPPGVVRVGRLQADLWDDLERLGIVSAQADTWRGALRALSTIERIEEQPVPSGLQAELRPYQVDGFNWLAFLYEHGLGGVLADEMGLGKTVQTLALMCHVQEKGLAEAPFLVVAPTSVVHNWAAECERFAPNLSIRTVTETIRRRRTELHDVAAGADVVVTSYTLLRLERGDYEALPWAGVVLDEAQFVKNHQALAHQCARRLDAPFKLAVTGTPLENNLMELWALLSISAPGLFPSPQRFTEHFRDPIERGRDADRLDQLRRRVRPLMMRRTKQQVIADLPDKNEQVLELDLHPKHRTVYQRHLQRERQKVLGMLGDMNGNRFEIFRSLTLLRQACLDASLVDPAHANVPATKLDVLLDHLVELAADGHRAVVFSQFTRFLEAARRRLDTAGIAYCYLDGKTRKRQDVIKRFKEGAAPVFLISLKAGGFGLNLTEADYCFLLDPWWNPATELQAVDRVHRIGQTRKVMVYRLVARDTIEDKVMALKAGKSALFDSVLSEGGATSGRLTAADIRGLLE